MGVLALNFKYLYVLKHLHFSHGLLSNFNHDFLCLVTFSRIDPGGKLVIGYRKASNAVEMQVLHPDPFTLLAWLYS